MWHLTCERLTATSAPLTLQLDGGTKLIDILQIQGLFWYFVKLGDELADSCKFKDEVDDSLKKLLE